MIGDARDGRIYILRAKRVVDHNYAVLLAVFLIIAAVGGWASYAAYIDPGTRSEERTVSEWTRTASFDHGAEVRVDNPVYTVGRRLEEQRAYYPRIAPTISGTYRIEYAATESGRVAIAVELRLVLQSKEEETVFWQTTRPLGGTSVTGVRPGNNTTVAYAFDANRTLTRFARIDDTLGRVPGEPEVLVRAETRISGEINGHPVARTYVDSLRFRPDGDTLRVHDPQEITNRTTTTRTVMTEREYGPVRRLGGPTATLAGLGGTLALIAVRRRDELALSSGELDRLARAEYDEWISPGTIPVDVRPGSPDVVELTKLADLVDVAADTDGRVVYAPDRELYAVFDEPYTYICQPPLSEDH